MRYACLPPLDSQTPFRLQAREPDALVSLMGGCVARLRLSTRVLHRFFCFPFPSALPTPLPLFSRLLAFLDSASDLTFISPFSLLHCFCSFSTLATIICCPPYLPPTYPRVRHVSVVLFSCARVCACGRACFSRSGVYSSLFSLTRHALASAAFLFSLLVFRSNVFSSPSPWRSPRVFEPPASMHLFILCSRSPTHLAVC